MRLHVGFVHTTLVSVVSVYLPERIWQRKTNYCTTEKKQSFHGRVLLYMKHNGDPGVSVTPFRLMVRLLTYSPATFIPSRPSETPDVGKCRSSASLSRARLHGSSFSGTWTSPMPRPLGLHVWKKKEVTVRRRVEVSPWLLSPQFLCIIHKHIYMFFFLCYKMCRVSFKGQIKKLKWRENWKLLSVSLMWCSINKYYT